MSKSVSKGVGAKNALQFIFKLGHIATLIVVERFSPKLKLVKTQEVIKEAC